MSGGTLSRLLRRSAEQRSPAGQGCGLCGVPTEIEHRHLLDASGGELLCACRPCSLLFSGEQDGDRPYLLVPQRRVRLDGSVPAKELGVPVGLAFFVPRQDGTVVARYPSPAGATQWEVDVHAWRNAVERCPELATIRPHTEALLINTARGRDDHWIAPVDDCFRMVGVVRREWRGLSGGSRVWPEIERFFMELTENH